VLRLLRAGDGLLNGEVAEAFDTWRNGRPDLAEELADALIFLAGLAQMVDASTA
jgi:NTP pyrophosphatase (non-canonical NTP hydrolase)